MLDNITDNNTAKPEAPVQAPLKTPSIKVKNKVGRPSSYKAEYCQRIIDYFSIPPYIIKKEIVKYRNGITTTKEKIVANDLPLFGMFAVKIGTDSSVLLDWKAKHKYFALAYKKAKELQENFLIVNTIKGLYNPVFAIFTAKNILGWKDTQDITTTGTNSTINLVSYGEQDPLKQYLDKTRPISPKEAIKKIKEVTTN